jgi:hypothetical protein
VVTVENIKDTFSLACDGVDFGMQVLTFRRESNTNILKVEECDEIGEVDAVSLFILRKVVRM